MAYKLTYFDVPGRGEPARLIFSAAGVKFVDDRVSHADWPSRKPNIPWGQLPVLFVGDKVLTQSKTICRYIGRKFKLAGADEWESAKCDELVDAMGDVTEAFVAFFWIEQDPAKKEEKKKKFYAETLPTFLSKINKVQLENGGTWLVGKSMTWADILIAETLRQIAVAPDPNALNSYPHIRKMFEAVNNNEGIKKFRAANPPK